MCASKICGYRCPDHVVTSEAHMTDEVEDVNSPFYVNLLQHVVNGDEGTSPSHTSTEGGEVRVKEVREEEVRKERVIQERGGV